MTEFLHISAQMKTKSIRLIDWGSVQKHCRELRAQAARENLIRSSSGKNFPFIFCGREPWAMLLGVFVVNQTWWHSFLPGRAAFGSLAQRNLRKKERIQEMQIKRVRAGLRERMKHCPHQAGSPAEHGPQCAWILPSLSPPGPSAPVATATWSGFRQKSPWNWQGSECEEVCWSSPRLESRQVLALVTCETRKNPPMFQL